jgi:hypothetical protein
MQARLWQTCLLSAVAVALAGTALAQPGSAGIGTYLETLQSGRSRSRSPGTSPMVPAS